MSQPEARLSRSIIKWLKEQGHFAFKIHGGPTMMAGLPDIVAVVHGRFLGVESKMPGNKASMRQRYVHGLIERAGGTVVVAYSLSDVRKAVDRVAGTITRADAERAAASRTDARTRFRSVIDNAIVEYLRIVKPTEIAYLLTQEDARRELARYIRDELTEDGYGKLGH